MLWNWWIARNGPGWCGAGTMSRTCGGKSLVELYSSGRGDPAAAGGTASGVPQNPRRRDYASAAHPAVRTSGRGTMTERVRSKWRGSALRDYSDRQPNSVCECVGRWPGRGECGCRLGAAGDDRALYEPVLLPSLELCRTRSVAERCALVVAADACAGWADRRLDVCAVPVAEGAWASVCRRR